MKRVLALLLMACGAQAIAADTQDAAFERAFDRNKGRLYAVYAAALRDNPQLSGKAVLRFEVAKTGDVTACSVQSSTLQSPALDARLCERMLTMKFPPRPQPLTATKSLEFFAAKP